MANEKLPEFKGQEQFQPGTQPLPFGDAYRKLAENSNVLGKLGAEVAMSAAQQGAQLAGIKYGKDPKGNTFPAFTKTDEAFTEAYRSTAYATLSVQADELMTNGVTTLLGSDGPLTQEGIDSFAANMLEGINDIAELAPDVDKETLKSQFASNLITSQGKLQEKLMNQDKARMQEEFAVWADENNRSVFNDGANGDKKKAKDEYDTFIEKAKAQLESGLLSKTQFETAKKAARISLLTGGAFGDYLKAKDNGKEFNFLHDFQSKTPKGWTPLEHNYVMQDLATRINSANNLDRQYQQNMLTEAQVQLNLGGITPELMNKITSEGDDTTKTKLALMLSSNKSRSDSSTKNTHFAIKHKNSTGELSKLKPEDINKAWRAVAESLQHANPNITDWEAKTLAYTGFALPASDYVKEFNAKAVSNSVEDKNEALMALRQLRNDKPGHLIGMNDDAISVLDAYESSLRGNPENVAAETANKLVLETDKAKEEVREIQWLKYKKSKNKKDWHRKADITKIMSDITGLKLKPEQISLALELEALLEQKVKALGPTLGEESFKKSLGLYKETNQNGFAETAYNPLEVSQNASPEELPLWQQQISEQVIFQLGDVNKVYDENTEKLKKGEGDPNDFYYKLSEFKEIKKEDQERFKLLVELSPLAKDMQRAKELANRLETLQTYSDEPPEELGAIFSELQGLVKGRARFKELQKLLKPYQEHKQPKISRIYRDGSIEDFTIGIYNPDTSASAYSAKLVDSENRPQNFLGAGDIWFAPNRKDFEEKYAKFIDISNSGGEGPLADVITGKRKAGEAMESLVEERKSNVVKDVKDIVSSTAKEIGVDEKIAAAIVKAESNFKASAKNPDSSAKGLYQFTRATWNTMVERYGEKYGVSKDDILKPEANAIMGALLTKENSEGLRRSLGREPTSAEVYLAHFAGLGRAIKITKAMAEDPSQPSSKFFTKQQIAANKGVIKKTIGETLKELARRAGAD